MKCFSLINNRRLFAVSSDSIAVNLNEINFVLSDGTRGTFNCTLSIYNDPQCVRLMIDVDSSGLRSNGLFETGSRGSVTVAREAGYVRVHNGEIRVDIRLSPWRVMIHHEKSQVCIYEIIRSSDNRLSLMTEVGGKTHIYGLAERASPSRLVSGQSYRLYNTDEFGLAQGTQKPLYGSVPFIAAVSRGSCVGLLSRNESETVIRLGGRRLRKTCRLHWSHEVGAVDFLCLPARNGLLMRRSLSRLTGATPLPPLFALGYHQCRWNYDDQEDIMKVDSCLREAGIPCDVLWLDIEHTDGKRYFTWDKTKFDPIALIAHLKKQGRQLVVIVDPHLKVDPDYVIYQEALDGGHLVKNEDGTPFRGECWPGDSVWVDFIGDDASSWWSSKICVYLEQLGCTNESNNLWIWNDMNEPSVFKSPNKGMKPVAVHSGQVQHRQVHNIYGQRMAKATWDGILKACGDNLRPFLLSRSFYTGSQKYGAIWTGDSLCSWSHLQVSVSMVLSLSICGIDFCGADVGGFFGDPEPELLCRWYQLGAFQPFFRAHAHIDSKRREPYLVEEPFKSAIKSAVRSRYQLLAYWYLCFWEAETSLLPVVSPVWMVFSQHDKKDKDDMYMIGTSILVRPIVSPLCKSISMTLPGTTNDIWYQYCQVSGRWQTHGVNKTRNLPVNIDSIPVFYRGGACLFLKEAECSSTEQWREAAYSIVMFPCALGHSCGQLYVDDCRSYAYRESGQYCLYRCTLDQNAGIIRVDTVHSSDTQHRIGPCKVTRITVVRKDSTSMAKYSSVSMDGDSVAQHATLTMFSDRLEITGIDLEISPGWTLRIT